MGSVLDETTDTSFGQRFAIYPNEDEADRLLPTDALPAPVLTPKNKLAEANYTEDDTQWDKSTLEVRPLVRFSTAKPPTRRFEVLQQFEGVVTSIEGDTVWADLHDLTSPTNPQEVVEIPLKEIPPADAVLLKPGTAFYWIIGYDTSPGGTLTRASEIRVRRTAAWSQRSISSIKEKAHEMLMRMTNGKV